MGQSKKTRDGIYVQDMLVMAIVASRKPRSTSKEIADAVAKDFFSKPTNLGADEQLQRYVARRLNQLAETGYLVREKLDAKRNDCSYVYCIGEKQIAA